MYISGGRSSLEVACWTADHWVNGSNIIVPYACLAQFGLNNVHKGDMQYNFIFHVLLYIYPVTWLLIVVTTHTLIYVTCDNKILPHHKLVM